MSKKPMKLPNGFGSITLLKGNRRKPYQARTPNSQKSIGTFETYNEAYQALMNWSGDAPSTEEHTFAEVYAMAIDAMKRSGVERAENTYKAYDSRFNALHPLHGQNMSEIRLQDLQAAIDALPLTKSTRALSIAVCHLVYEYACKYDYCEKDYSIYLSPNAPSAKPNPDKYFFDGELAVLKKLADSNETAMRLLVMCYTGFRISAYYTWEVHDGYVLGGVKQRRSSEYKPRIVPIHPKIAKYIPDFRLPQRSTFAQHMEQFEEAHGIRRLTPHATRHTFSYLLDKAGVDDVTAKLLMGHSLGSDVHTNVYKHRSYEQLADAIKALPF